MCGRVEEMVRRYPDYIAYEFMGKCTTYADMWKTVSYTHLDVYKRQQQMSSLWKTNACRQWQKCPPSGLPGS